MPDKKTGLSSYAYDKYVAPIIKREKIQREAEEAMMRDLEKANTINAARHQAVLETAENTKQTADEVESLRNELYVLHVALEKERNSRRKSDADAMQYTKKMDRVNLFLAAFAICVSVFSVILQFVL